MSVLREIETYCYMIQRGKPASVSAVQNRYIDEAKELVETKYNLKVYIECLAEGWSNVWVYKQDYMLEIIKALPEQPNTIYDHWVLGKLFGYSDESIAEFINKLNTVRIGD
jgi:hypothetical protein